ncbi:MAG TPA: 30S ribosomal protein S6 [Fimbriimonadales bacterium]|nr:30S ribosomal protein S6 [Fimbriimonadales bacterium]
MTNNLRAYEALYIVPANLTEEALQSILEKHSRVIEEQGGKVQKAEVWDKRKLAYPIKGNTEGNYLLLEFQAPPHVPSELRRIFRISDEVIRARIFKKE